MLEVAQANYVHVTGPLGCVRCDFTTQKWHDAGVSLEGQQRVFDGHLNTEHPGWMLEKPQETERSSLEREALDCLLAWYTEKDPSKRSVAWIRMLAAAGDLVAFESSSSVDK